MTRLALDVNNMLAPRLQGEGVDPQRLAGSGDLAAAFARAHAEMERRRAAGQLGFLELPHNLDVARTVSELADSFGQWFEDVVVLGIGGSGLGAVMLREALLPPHWNELSDEARSFHPRLHVVDNPDPRTTQSLLERLDLRRTLVIVVSKSGSTAETMALYLVFRERISQVVDADKVRGHFIFVTDPTEGVLRRIADAEAIPTLPIPPNVGGRFSVLSPVGLLPAAICGIDPVELLQGAAAAEGRFCSPDLLDNPAGMLAVLLHAADVERGQSIHVLMPYADRLRALTLWFQQLWAESLGKRSGDGHVGPTPLPALGATDQHAQVQLFMEGPRDKVVVFIATPADDVALGIPRLHADEPALAYLGGHTLGELLDVERRATAEALRQQQRASMTLELPQVDAQSIGALVLLLELGTVYAGALYGIEPLDQPGVELGKQLTYGLMGKAGVDVPEIVQGDERWRL